MSRERRTRRRTRRIRLNQKGNRLQRRKRRQCIYLDWICSMLLCDSTCRSSLKKSRTPRRFALMFAMWLSACSISRSSTIFFWEAIAAATRKIQDAEGKFKQDVEGDGDLPGTQVQFFGSRSVISRLENIAEGWQISPSVSWRHGWCISSSCWSSGRIARAVGQGWGATFQHVETMIFRSCN